MLRVADATGMRTFRQTTGWRSCVQGKVLEGLRIANREGLRLTCARPER